MLILLLLLLLLLLLMMMWLLLLSFCWLCGGRLRGRRVCDTRHRDEVHRASGVRATLRIVLCPRLHVLVRVRRVRVEHKRRACHYLLLLLLRFWLGLGLRLRSRLNLRLGLGRRISNR